MNSRSIIVMIFIGACILLSTCCTIASAESSLGFRGIGVRIGYVAPEGDLDGNVEFGVAFEFGEFVRHLYWDGSVSFWSTGRDYQYYTGSQYDKYNWSLRDLVLRSGVDYHFFEGPWAPYVGGGLGLHFYSWDYSGAPHYNNTSDSKFGLYVDGGIERKFSENWSGQLQVQFDFADPDQTALLFDLIYHIR